MINRNELKFKCFNHFDRESVAICVACSKPFCRECVSFYEDKMTCSFCIKEKIKKNKIKLSNKGSILCISLLLIFLGLGWLFFYSLGIVLANIPSELSE